MIKRINVFGLYIFILPIVALWIEIGVSTTFAEVLLFLISIFISIYIILSHRFTFHWFGNNRFLFIFFTYICFSTIIISNLFIDNQQVLSVNYFRSEGRYVSQILLNLVLYSPFLVTRFFIKDKIDIIKYSKIFIRSVVILSIIGFFQEIVFLFSDQDLIAPRHMGEVLGFLRISSLCGEPKGFAGILSVAYFVIDSFNKFNQSLFKRDFLIKFCLMAALFLTFSTSGYLSFLLVFFVTNILNPLLARSLSKNLLTKTVSLSMVLSLVFIFGDFFSKVYNERIDYRLEQRNVLYQDGEQIGLPVGDDTDEVIFIFLKNNPSWLVFGTGMGNVHKLANSYIPDKYKYYMEDSIFVAKTGYMRYLSEFGIIGFLLFVFFNFSVIGRLFSLYRKTRDLHGGILFLISLSVFLLFLTRGHYIILLYTTFLAFGNTYLNNVLREG